MNLRTDFPVLLRIRSLDDSDDLREQLLTALLSGYDVSAIHENEEQQGICWDVSFDELAWPQEDGESRWFTLEDYDAPLDVGWRRYPDLGELMAVKAGNGLVRTFGERITCGLRVPLGWSVSDFEESFGRIQVGRVIVVPPWQFPDPGASEILIKIKPSMGFGTGHHPSTRLSLSLLQKVSCVGRDVLDVGTGSGILAIAAARLGARRVCGIDRDRDALTAAAESVRRNAQASRVELRAADVSTDLIGDFDIVVANLDAAQLEAWAPQLMRHTRAEGQLLISGFLAAEADMVRHVLPMTVFEQEGDWCAGIVEVSSLRTK